MIRALFLFSLLTILARAADDDATWSKPLNGLQARLFMSTPAINEHGRDRRLHFQMFFQMRRRDDEVAQLQVAYSPTTLALQVVDEAGKPLEEAGVGGSQMEGPWQPLIFPSDAFISFPIGHSSWDRAGVWEGEYLDFHFWTQWKIAPSSKTYYMVGTFTIPVTPRDPSNPINVWGGKIILPKIQIPKIP